MNKSLMTIVLETAAFWELAGDDMVNPEAADEQLEGLVETLGQLTAAEKAEFIQFAQEYAEDEVSAGGTPERERYFRSIGRSLGLA